MHPLSNHWRRAGGKTIRPVRASTGTLPPSRARAEHRVIIPPWKETLA
jgi:hypothetical protein